MKHLFLFIVGSIAFGSGYAQHTTLPGIPDFAEVVEVNRFDSIENWYTTYVANAKIDSLEKVGLVNSLLKYNENGSDLLSEIGVYFIAGNFYLNMGVEDKGMGYLNKAIALTEENHLKYEYARCMHKAGMYEHNIKHDVGKSLEYLLKAEKAMSEIPTEKHIKGVFMLNLDMGYLNFYWGTSQICLDKLLPLLLYEEKLDPETRLLFNDIIALAYRETKKYDSAIFYCLKTKRYAQRQSKKDWVNSMDNAIAWVYLRQKEYDSVLVYATSNYEYRIQHGGALNEATYLLAEANAGLHKPDIALKWVGQYIQISNGIKGNSDLQRMDYLYKAYPIYAKAYADKGDYKRANEYSRKLRELHQVYLKKITSLKLADIRVQVESERNLANIKKIEAETALSVQRRNFSLIALVMFGFILFNLYKRQQLKNKKNKEIFQSREQLLFLEKKRSEEQLISYMDSLQEKNRLIEDFQEEIEKLNALPKNNENQQSIETLEKLQKATIITDDDWTTFKALFEKAHVGFFVRLKQKYPDITPAEMRLLALVKLRVSRKQMAGMLGISPDSIRKTGSRFIKKLSSAGESDTDLSEIVAAL